MLDGMKIVDLRTGRALASGLSASEISTEMEVRIRQACKASCISAESTEKIVRNYKRTGFQPFMFEVAK